MWFRDYKYHTVAPFLVQDMKINANKNEYFLYARKPSESEDRQVQSIDDQVNRLKQLAVAQGIKIKEILVESKSAKKPDNRPVFAQMIQRIKEGEAQGILCWQINRLTRNPVDSGTISWMLQEGLIHSIQTMEREYKPEDNTLLMSVETGMANQFILDLKKNVKRGMDGKADRGDYPTKPPTGYLNDRLNKKIIVDEERFQLIRKMWDMMLSGNYTPPQILEIVNRDWGFRTVKTLRGGNKELARSTIYKIFNNIFYVGLFEWNGEIRQGNHKAMITLEEFDVVQKLLGKEGRQRMTKQEHAYTGEIHCGECGCLHTGTTKVKTILSTGEQKSYTYYYCTRKKKGINCTQTKPLTAQEVELQIDKELAKSQIKPKFLQWALDYLNERNELEVGDRSKVYESQQATYNKTQNELDGLSKMYYKELISEEEFIRMRDDLRSQLAKLKLAMNSTEERASKWLDQTQELFQFATYARIQFNNPKTTTQQKRAIFRGLGWNFIMKDQLLSISKHKWLETIENEYPALETRLERLELNKTLDTAKRNKQIDLVRSDWCAYRDSNPD